jgi:hypothetical protein
MSGRPACCNRPLKILIRLQGSIGIPIVPAEAIRWGMDQMDVNGQPVFKDEAHAQSAYDKVKREKQPQSARDMRDAWVEEVLRRAEMIQLASNSNEIPTYNPLSIAPNL